MQREREDISEGPKARKACEGRRIGTGTGLENSGSGSKRGLDDWKYVLCGSRRNAGKGG